MLYQSTCFVPITRPILQQYFSTQGIKVKKKFSQKSLIKSEYMPCLFVHQYYLHYPQREKCVENIGEQFSLFINFHILKLELDDYGFP